MRKLLKYFSIDVLALYFVAQITDGMVFEGGVGTFFVTAAALTATSILGKPILKIMILPLNLITFGLFGWIGNSVVLYIVTLLVSGFRIEGFFFQGFVSKWIDLPTINLSGVMAFVAFSFLLSFVTSLFHWLSK